MIGLDLGSGLMSTFHQGMTQNNADLLSIKPNGKCSSEIWIKYQHFFQPMLNYYQLEPKTKMHNLNKNTKKLF